MIIFEDSQARRQSDQQNCSLETSNYLVFYSRYLPGYTRRDLEVIWSVTDTLVTSQDLGHPKKNRWVNQSWVHQSILGSSIIYARHVRRSRCRHETSRAGGDNEFSPVCQGVTLLVDAGMHCFQKQELQSREEFGGIWRGGAGDELPERRRGGVAGAAGRLADRVSSCSSLQLLPSPPPI